MKQTEKQKDRHLNTQMVIWVPPGLKAAFMKHAQDKMSNASHELRQFMASQTGWKK